MHVKPQILVKKFLSWSPAHQKTALTERYSELSQLCFSLKPTDSDVLNSSGHEPYSA